MPVSSARKKCEWSGAGKHIASDSCMYRAIEEEAFWAGLLERWILVPLVIKTLNAIESRFIVLYPDLSGIFANAPLSLVPPIFDADAVVSSKGL